MRFKEVHSKNNYNNEIEIVLRSRIQMQSNQNILNKQFNLYLPDFKSITNPSFLLGEYQNWDILRKKAFLITIGGPVNVDKTKNYLSSLIKKYAKEVWQTGENGE